MPKPLRIKFLSTSPPGRWRAYFDDPARPTRPGCEFVFADDATDYDWAVVYERLPRSGKSEVALCCSQENTLLITTEPPTIRRYTNVFTRQFGHVLTSHPQSALPHLNRVYSQPALKWFYGTDGVDAADRSQLRAEQPTKSRNVSVVCSSKRQGHTLHRRRHDFVQELSRQLPDLDWFGHGVRPMQDKAEALRPYRYHVAIENHVGQHHWTEKLADAFLGHTLPLYFGCPNLSDYFPEDSFLRIDIQDAAAAADLISRAVADDLYSQRLPAIREARRRVLEEFDLFSVISRIVLERHQPGRTSGVLRSQKALRLRHPFVSLSSAIRTELRVLAGRWS